LFKTTLTGNLPRKVEAQTARIDELTRRLDRLERSLAAAADER
jgi:hypothetical protein